MKPWLSFLLVSVSVGLGACDGDEEGGDDGGGDGSGTTKIYCQTEEAGAVTGCNEHTIPNAALETSREACTSGGGTLETACPTAGLTGKCALANAGLVMHFYDPDNAADDQQLCDGLGGTWTAP
jgi:hypothetical protein